MWYTFRQAGRHNFFLKKKFFRDLLLATSVKSSILAVLLPVGSIVRVATSALNQQSRVACFKFELRGIISNCFLSKSYPQEMSAL